MRLVFMGTPDFAVPCLEHLLRNQHQVVAVYTRPDKPAGRGRLLLPSPVKGMALRCRLPVVQPASLKSPEVVGQLKELQPEAIVVAAYGQLLPPAVLDLPPHGCLNVHPSLLPRYRGASPVAAAILAGDEFTGVSIILMDAGMDRGPLLAQGQVAMGAQDTTGTMTLKLSLVGARLLAEALVAWGRRELAPQPQQEGQATYCGTITRAEAEIDWKLPAVLIGRRVRAYQPRPGAHTYWRDLEMKIVEARPLPGRPGMKAGQVIETGETDAAIGVATGDGVLGIRRVQLAGKRVMTAGEFLRGQRGIIGSILPG